MSGRLSEQPTVHPTADVTGSTLGRYTEIGERTRFLESSLGDYSYLVQDCGVWCATIGKFANIAAAVRINATNHPTWRPTLHHFTYRASDYWAKPIRERFDRRTAERCQALAWWDWDHAKLHAALGDFRTLSAEAFLEKHGG